VGQSQYLGPILVAVIVRELGPLMANLIVIGRSGNAIAAEMAIMKVTGEVRVLDAQGIDPFIYLVVPRILAMSLCVFCLTVIFIAVCLISGYVCGMLVGVKTSGASGFIDSLAGAIGPDDIINVLIKSFIPGLFSGTICCVEGLRVGTAITEVPPAVSRAMQRSVVTTFLISAVVSLLTYL
jgi:phospholipid/cholesterol/gamma-HCH transport system permease protein